MKFILPITLLSLCIPIFMSAQQYEDILKNRRVQLYQDGYKTLFAVGEYNKVPKRDKSYYWYSTQQIRTTEGGYSGRVLHGPYTRYYTNNNLAESGTFKNGLKHGPWRSWYADGGQQKESTWKDGEESGTFRLWDQQGRLLEQGRLRKGQRQGKVKAWNKDTKTAIDQYFDQGREITREEYAQRNVFSRTGNYIGKKWQKLFSKKEKATSD